VIYSTLSVYCVYIQENLLVKGEMLGINELISDEIINSIACKIRKYLASSVTIIRMIPCKGTVLYIY
jgi:hypothetical protein